MKSKLIEKLLTGKIVEIETDVEYKELVKFWKKTDAENNSPDALLNYYYVDNSNYGELPELIIEDRASCQTVSNCPLRVWYCKRGWVTGLRNVGVGYKDLPDVKGGTITKQKADEIIAAHKIEQPQY